MLKDVKKNDEVVLIGTGTYEEELPYEFDLMKTDVWVLGPKAFNVYNNNTPFPYNCLFEIHNKKYSPFFRRDDYQEFLKKTPVRKIMQRETYAYPITEKYPLKEIIDEYKTNFFLCSISYMIALVIYMGYKKITLRGINMIMTDDLIQKGGVDFWLGIAMGRGIEISVSDACNLLKCGKMYGYECDNTLAVYQQRYMNSLTREIANYLRRGKEFYSTMSEISETIGDLFNMLTVERRQFMNNVLDRHEVKFEVEGDGLE